MIDQIVRLTLDAHSLEEIDRRSTVEAKKRARAERVTRVRALGLDRPRLLAFLAQLQAVSRERFLAEGHLLPDAPPKGTAMLTSRHRSGAGEL